MNPHDHAIVIGIQTYPGLGNLEGPCIDAERFRDWLVSPSGGGVPNVQTSLTTNYPAPNGVVDARPVLDDLFSLFRPHISRAARHEHVPGRLFIYVAGHGFGDSQKMDAAALYVANAEALIPLHLAVTSYAEWFRRNRAFDEIIVIMDCCRTRNPLHPVQPPHLPNTLTNPNASRVRTFQAFATGSGHLARERMREGVTSGIFTDSLLDALHHARPNRLGRVTGSIVCDYVHNVINGFAGGVKVDPPEFKLDSRREVILAQRVTVSGMAVELKSDPGLLGQELVILDGQFQEVYRTAIPSVEFSIELPAGLYKAVIDGSVDQCLFQVPSHEPILL